MQARNIVQVRYMHLHIAARTIGFRRCGAHERNWYPESSRSKYAKDNFPVV